MFLLKDSTWLYFNIMRIYWKTFFFRGGFTKDQFIRGGLPWTASRFKIGRVELVKNNKRVGWYFWGDWYPNAHYSSLLLILNLKNQNVQTSTWRLHVYWSCFDIFFFFFAFQNSFKFCSRDIISWRKPIL